jgi:hypothetical protein
VLPPRLLILLQNNDHSAQNFHHIQTFPVITSDLELNIRQDPTISTTVIAAKNAITYEMVPTKVGP